MENEEENHAWVADEEAPTEFSLMAKSSIDNEVFHNSLCSKACKKNTDSLNSKITELSERLGDTKNMLYHCKLGLSQVEARLVEFKNQEIKFCEKIRGLKFSVECKTNRIENLTNELKTLKKEKEGLDRKLTVYSPPKKDMSWTGLPEFADDTITDYTRPSPSVESNPNDLQNNSSSVFEIGESTENQQSEFNPKFQEFPLLIENFPLLTESFPLGNSQINIDDKGYWDSGCSWHMTGNISYLSDYEPFYRGYVSFGQGGYKITGKGTIKTGYCKGEEYQWEAQLHAKVDGKKVAIFEASIRRDLQFRDEGGVDSLPNKVIFKQLTLMGAKTTAWNKFSSTMASAVICLATNQKFNFSKYIFDSMVKHLASGKKFLMYPRKTKRKDTQVPQLSMPTESNTYEVVNEEMSDSLERVTTTATSLDAKQDRGNINKTQSKETLNEASSIGTSSARVESSKEKGLGEEDASKQRRIIDDLDADNDITLVNDQEMFDADKDYKVKKWLLNKRLLLIKSQLLMMHRGIVIKDHEEPSESRTTTTISLKKSQNKGKAKMIEEPVKLKKKDQILFDEEVARKLQEEINKKERLVGEKARQQEEASITLIETWEDIQAKLDADYQLAERMQAEEQQELNEEEKAKLFMELLEKRIKFFATKRAKEKRNRPPNKAQQRSLMCTYLKNMDGWKPRALKNKSFAKIQELFDEAMKKINTFVNFRTELVEESTKKDEAETTQESSSKRAGDELE
uniref:Retrovirus-related Pol polyprotein from transposon TNT 1-94-like beta-barrel domain-containing protein n=1 Tax=Tanacetum cinerariifolium TaxID=118510 RepID=A0A6L2M4Q4_TANCI|nr:hypothetical protein [Tanacetum cinerariifolium]